MIKPLKDYILLEEPKYNTTESGIILGADVDMERPNIAKVITIGGVASFQEGDTVLIKRHLFDEVKLDDKEYLIGKEEGVVAIITSEIA